MATRKNAPDRSHNMLFGEAIGVVLHTAKELRASIRRRCYMYRRVRRRRESGRHLDGLDDTGRHRTRRMPEMPGGQLQRTRAVAPVRVLLEGIDACKLGRKALDVF